MGTGLLVAALLCVDSPQRFSSADGNRWTVSRQPNTTYVQVERVGRDGGREVIKLDDSGQLEPDGGVTRTNGTEFSVDAKGVFQVLLSNPYNPPVVARWNGKEFYAGPEPEPPQVFTSADGNRWTVTRPVEKGSGAYREWNVQVERLGRDGGTEVIDFEESFTNGQKTLHSKRVEFSIDAKGVFQAVESSTTEHRRGRRPDEVTKVVLKWNGSAFEKAKTP